MSGGLKADLTKFSLVSFMYLLVLEVGIQWIKPEFNVSKV